MSTRSSNKSIGPIIGTLIVVIIIIAASFYVFASHVNRQSTLVTSPDASSTVQFGTITNTADDVQSIKNDLNRSIK